MITFNSYNLIVGQIKEILRDYNLPYCKVLVDNAKIEIYKDCCYIYKMSIYKCIKTNDFTKSGFTFSDEYFTPVMIYTENEEIDNITHNLIIRNNYYDELTHKTLGDYLRFKRDYSNLNLMSMYNCFSGSVARNFKKTIEIDDKTIIYDTNSKEYKLCVVPVKLWKSYEIHIENMSAVEICACLYDDGNLVSLIDRYSNNHDITKELMEKTYQRVGGLRFNVPYIYDKLKTNFSNISNEDYRKLIFENEVNLCLLIKLPFYSNSSIVVLELEDSDTNKIIYNEHKQAYSNYTYGTSLLYKDMPTFNLSMERQIVNLSSSDTEQVNEYLSKNTSFITRKQLTLVNDNVQHPFADRLIEYLCENTIDSRNTILLNNKLVENYLIGNKYISGYTPSLLWTNNLQNILYQIEISNPNYVEKYFDSLGYVDKSLEEYVLKKVDDKGKTYYTLGDELEG